MSKADEMFEKLGYKLETNTPTNLIYLDEDDKEIRFWKIQKCVEVSLRNIEDNQANSMFFDMQELQAINEKVKELGWED